MEIKPFRLSPPSTLHHELGICSLKIDYARPGVKGRRIFGELVPFDHIWRAGANAATVLTLSHPARIGGQEIAAGSYALFAIPGEDHWTWILNRNTTQFGVYSRKDEEDVLRWTSRPQAAAHTEWLTFDVRPDIDRGWHVELRWEKTAVAFDIELDIRGIYWKNIEEVLSTARDDEAMPWFMAALYCLQAGVHLDQGMTWIEKSLRIEETFRSLDCYARLLHKTGRTAEAIPHMERALALAAGKVPREFAEFLEKQLREWKQGR